ncbi:hypothetical protein EDD86DRAFT_207112 [Gorgonomyces haynaldii]|nr:hypothetical protein EDD86DRAFT_207112 [Gorgonomyces haynaldii]
MGNFVTTLKGEVETKAKEFMAVQQLQAMRQQKNMRDTQLATAIAGQRDMVLFMGSAVSMIALVGIAKRPFPVQVVPVVVVGHVLAYNCDMAYGTKMNRIYAEAQRIRKEEGWWFNEPMDLPPLIKPFYRSWMDHQNQELVSKGFEPLQEWGK